MKNNAIKKRIAIAVICISTIASSVVLTACGDKNSDNESKQEVVTADESSDVDADDNSSDNSNDAAEASASTTNYLNDYFSKGEYTDDASSIISRQSSLTSEYGQVFDKQFIMEDIYDFGQVYAINLEGVEGLKPIPVAGDTINMANVTFSDGTKVEMIVNNMNGTKKELGKFDTYIGVEGMDGKQFVEYAKTNPLSAKHKDVDMSTQQFDVSKTNDGYIIKANFDLDSAKFIDENPTEAYIYSGQGVDGERVFFIRFAIEDFPESGISSEVVNWLNSVQVLSIPKE